MSKKNALGRGLGALIPAFGEEKVDKPEENFTKTQKLSTNKEQDVDNFVDKANKVLSLPISKVEPRPSQPRILFDEKSLNELAESIRQHGVLQPILVVRQGAHFEIVAGERRWRAAKLAGLKKIPAILKEYDGRDISELALIENIQREDLNPIEEAQAYRQLIDEYGLKQEELALRVAKNRATIANSLRLLKLDEKVQAMVMDGSISEGHARSLLSLSDKKQQLALAQEIVSRKLSVREVEQRVRKSASPQPPKKVFREEKDQTAYDELVLSLRRSLGTKVSIRRTDREKGQVIIDYYSVDELERIAEKLK